MRSLGVTMGDAAGVGPEIILKAFRDDMVNDHIVVIGDYSAFVLCNEILSLGVPLYRIDAVEKIQDGNLNILDMALLSKDDILFGQLNKRTGYAAYEYVKRATELALLKKIAGIVTLPINKESVRLTISDFTGHTEYIAQMCGDPEVTMMLWSDRLTVTHVSTHVSMRQAVDLVNKDRVQTVIRLTRDALLGMNANPRIAVAGLNAHAGEHGAFGDEEIREIKPAVEAVRAEGIQAYGPISPDTVFFRAVRGEFDAVVCMYHDQGHIPMKLLDFEGGVNVTLGLPIIRTSVDHGTAFDIAYKGIASTRSYVAAVRLAESMVTTQPLKRY